MFADARLLPSGSLLRADLCIIGGGAAGITLAREFADSRVSVFVLESGGFDADTATQALYEGEAVGRPYPVAETRLRYFGGSTNCWAGWCRPLDPIDFESRPWIPSSGWPFTFAELEPFYERAQSACQLGSFDYELDSWAACLPRPLMLDTGDIRNVMWQRSRPTRFGRAYRGQLERPANITVLLHANVTDLVTDEGVRKIEYVNVACLTGPRFRVGARLFVLACGGIENARLLLNSDKQVPAGLGNNHDMVGRFFMEHLQGIVNEVVFSRSDPVVDCYARWVRPSPPSLPARAWRRLRRELGLAVSRPPVLHVGFSVTEGAQRREGLLNWSATLEADDYRPTSDVAVDIGVMTTALETGSVPPEHVTGAYLHIRAEQAPNPTSRVKLAAHRDQLGMRTVTLDWRLTDLDLRSIREGSRLLGLALGRAAVGRLRLGGELWDGGAGWMFGSSHHTGTTRASDNPRQGVVDRNCRVHGIENLYIAGSSVFPTGGFASPTLTIVALTYRLAAHIKPVLQSGQLMHRVDTRLDAGG